MDNETIVKVYNILFKEYQNWQAPIITLISERGGSPFEVLISTILSLRTKDDVTAAAYARLSEKAASPETLITLGEAEISRLIYPTGFYRTKAANIIKICHILLEEYGGEVPSEMEDLLKLPNVGRKTANLVLTEGFHVDAMCVDVHVHRISNRFGYVDTKTPEQTEMALREKLPRPLWSEYNTILVAFGQLLCRPISPFCKTRCPVSDFCEKVGVERSR